MDEKVYIYDCKIYKYPIVKPYHPNVNYPEYPFVNLSKDKNQVYDSVRNLFKLMELDIDNFGTEKWNPLKDLIKPGDNVIIKPNMVMNETEKIKKEALITNGSIIRAILDYSYIALKGEGKITIADSPIQSCDFDKVIQNNGVKEIKSFYDKEATNLLKILDFRQEQAKKIEKIFVSIEKKLPGDPLGYSIVDLSNKSAFNDCGIKRFTITNYDPKIMKKHHCEDKHEYLIPNTLLQADVIINLPKPKTHRKAGITACQKNMVGITGNKAWLPHHAIGSISEGGDEYLNKNFFRKLSGFFTVKRDLYSLKGMFRVAIFFVFLVKVCGKFSNLFFIPTEYSEGSWWGNDTIWRTITDLNTIASFSDKEGKIREVQQRKIFNVCDMIISGEGEGPLQPKEKKVGVLIAGFNSLKTDLAIAKLMGFDFKKIPSLYNGVISKKINLLKMEIKSNNMNFSNLIGKIHIDNSYRFIAAKGWKDNIELEDTK